MTSIDAVAPFVVAERSSVPLIWFRAEIGRVFHGDESSDYRRVLFVAGLLRSLQERARLLRVPFTGRMDGSRLYGWVLDCTTTTTAGALLEAPTLLVDDNARALARQAAIDQLGRDPATRCATLHRYQLFRGEGPGLLTATYGGDPAELVPDAPAADEVFLALLTPTPRAERAWRKRLEALWRALCVPSALPRVVSRSRSTVVARRTVRKEWDLGIGAVCEGGTLSVSSARGEGPSAETLSWLRQDGRLQSAVRAREPAVYGVELQWSAAQRYWQVFAAAPPQTMRRISMLLRRLVNVRAPHSPVPPTPIAWTDVRLRLAWVLTTNNASRSGQAPWTPRYRRLTMLCVPRR